MTGAAGAQRLALAAWWENQLTKRKKAFAETAVLRGAYHQVRLHALSAALLYITQYNLWVIQVILQRFIKSAHV
jgi:hypothetical protein